MPYFHTLLVEAPQGRHFCQLHKNSESLDSALLIYLINGLRRNDAIVAIAKAARLNRMREQIAELRELPFDPDRLQLLEAEPLLGRIMHADKPNWRDFRRIVGDIIERMRDGGRSQLRLYGELVNDLWRAGNPTAAIRLEEFWNEVAREFSLCLFCGYEIDGLDLNAYDHPLHEIGRTHQDVLGTHDDQQLLAALDAASMDVLGIPVSRVMNNSQLESRPGEHRLPLARRTLLWLQRNMPSAMIKIVERAQHYLPDSAGNRKQTDAPA